MGAAQAKNINPSCMWRHPDAYKPYPQMYNCEDGQTYFYGNQTCGNEVLKNAFCLKSKAGSIASCKENMNTSVSQKCFEKYIAPTLDVRFKENEKKDGLCKWGWNGGEQFHCGNDIYLYGKASCTAGIYAHLFCKYAFASSGTNCANDNHPDTVACYKKFRQLNNKSETSKKTLKNKGTQ